VTNNDTLRSLRYTFNLNDSKMMEMFTIVEQTASRAEISSWLKPEDDPDFKECGHESFSHFLNGLIVKKRGRKDGPLPLPARRVTNNLVLKKLKIALDLKSDDVLAILELGGQKISSHEVTAFFRKPEHRNFRQCKDQVLRKFLKGLQLKYRPAEGTETAPS